MVDFLLLLCHIITMRRLKGPLFISIIIVLIFSSFSCSINKLAVRAAGRVLSSSGSGALFTGDEDPELIADALPLALKLYEALLSQDPGNVSLLNTAGVGFISYANAFVHTPASMLPDDKYQEQKEMYSRAKKLYLRGRDYLLTALEAEHPGFADLLKKGEMELILSEMTLEDVPLLYWSAAGWMAAISLDLFDFNLTMEAYKAVALMAGALELSEDYSGGSIHEFFVSLYGSLPENMMYRPYDPSRKDGVKEILDRYYSQKVPGAVEARGKAEYHFNRAVDLSKGLKASPYVSFATAFSKKEDTPKEYIVMLEKALSVDVEKSPENKLMNILTRRKARFLLDHLEDAFPFYEE